MIDRRQSIARQLEKATHRVLVLGLITFLATALVEFVGFLSVMADQLNVVTLLEPILRTGETLTTAALLGGAALFLGAQLAGRRSGWLYGRSYLRDSPDDPAFLAEQEQGPQGDC